MTRSAGSALLLAWRLHRAELAAVALAAVALSVLELSVAARLDALVAGCRDAPVVVAPCGGPISAGTIYDTATQAPMYLGIQGLAVLPFAAGVVLGVPLISRELEHGTARLSWPLARSRRRWVALRVLPVGLLGAVILLVPAMAGEVLYRSLYPPIDPAANFEGFGARGPLLVLRFIPALVIGALVGAWIGRQLPALLVAGILAAAIGIGLMQVQPLWVEPAEQAHREEWEPIQTVGDLFVRVRYRAADGEWMRDEDAWAILAMAGEEPRTGLPQEVIFSIPRERYPEVALRESLALVAASGALGGLLLLVVQRRRPG